MLGGDWPEADAELSRDGPPDGDVAWVLRGRAISAHGDPRAGLCEIRAPLLRACLVSSLRIGGSAAEPAGARQTPVDVVRRLAGGGRSAVERWMPALDLPVVLWEISSNADIDAELNLTVQTAATSGDATCTLEQAGECGLITIATTGSDAVLHVLAVRGMLRCDPAGGGTSRIAVAGHGRLRLAFVIGRNQLGLARVREFLERRGVAALVTQRTQHARLLRDYGTAISTPDPELDRSFEWAKSEASAHGLLAAGLREDARAELKRSSAASEGAGVLADEWVRWVGVEAPVRRNGLLVPATRARWDAALFQQPDAVIEQVIARLWGVSPDAPAAAVWLAPLFPAEWRLMTLRRLRVGLTVLDCKLRRRPGGLVARIERRSGPPINVTLTFPDEPVSALAVDGIELGGRGARFDAVGQHEVTFDA